MEFGLFFWFSGLFLRKLGRHFDVSEDMYHHDDIKPIGVWMKKRTPPRHVQDTIQMGGLSMGGFCVALIGVL